jgi:C4-dicarboxylate-specific signal transduction histidine kinase
MCSEYDSIGESGLRFFGKVSASIAHEIKNVLAIINENAGLLEDLTYAAQKGAAIDPERLNRACRQFSKQITRADHIVKNMSRFAHSVDQFEAQVNLHDLAVLVGSLAGRLAAMRKLTIVVEQPEIPVMINTNPFLLENLLWLCLEFTLGATGAGSGLRLIAEEHDGRKCIRIIGMDGLNEDYLTQMPAGHADLLHAIGAQLVADIPEKELTLVLT